MRKTTIKSILAKVTKTDKCWLWDGCVDRGGYGEVGYESRKVMVHRLVYELLVGNIPEKYEIDHLCKVRNCINPDHLEAVTRAENCRRSDSPWAKNARKTHCKQGHEFDEINTYYIRTGGRSCKTCSRNNVAKKRDYYNANRRLKRQLARVV